MITPTQHNNNKVCKFPVFSEERELQKFLEVNFTESLKQMIKVTVKTMVKAEMEEFRKDLEQKIYFNGYYDRNMISSFGKVDDIPVPRFRQSQSAVGMELKSLSVFGLEQEKFFHLVEQMHLLGISQRKIKSLAQSCFGIKFSADRVGRVYRELAEREEININSQLLNDDFEHLVLDGIWEKTKGYGWEENKSVLLCALGIKPNGEKKIIGFCLSRSEDTESWKELVKQLKQRGLKGENLKLAIVDDNQAIKNALSIFYPNLLVQNCIVHKMRNVIGKTKYKNRKEMAEDLKSIFNSQNKKEAEDKSRQVVKKWYLVEPKATESLRHNLEYCFTYLDFPKEVWTKIRTTNVLEREFREVRRRMKVFDNTFQNENSANNYANSMFNYFNNNYPLKKGLHTNA